ncbi:MAG: hypothetical protein CMJ08_02865 [Pelagibacterales bacterium]|nr:hypothetical protein [Pelagibacterales bacterium]
MRLIKLIRINFANNFFLLLPDGSIYWPINKTLILGDLHLEKSSFLARLGNFLPPYDSFETLYKLSKTLNNLDVNKVIFLGDIFHDKDGMKRINNKLHNYLENLCAKYQVIWIVGNHDGSLKPKNAKICIKYNIDDINFVHKSEKNITNEFSGHYHPKATVKFFKKKISRPCFLVGKSKIILPAYGVFTGGIDSSDEIFKKVLEGDYKGYLTLKEKLIKIDF